MGHRNYLQILPFARMKISLGSDSIDQIKRTQPRDFNEV
jgi:hypothetical protein